MYQIMCQNTSYMHVNDNKLKQLITKANMYLKESFSRPLGGTSFRVFNKTVGECIKHYKHSFIWLTKAYTELCITVESLLMWQIRRSQILGWSTKHPGSNLLALELHLRVWTLSRNRGKM